MYFMPGSALRAGACKRLCGWLDRRSGPARRGASASDGSFSAALGTGGMPRLWPSSTMGGGGPASANEGASKFSGRFLVMPCLVFGVAYPSGLRVHAIRAGRKPNDERRRLEGRRVVGWAMDCGTQPG